MKKIPAVLGLLGVVTLVLVFVIHEATQTQPDYLNMQTTWYGGFSGFNRIVEGKNLDQISVEADVLAAFFGGPVQYKTEDEKIVYQAYPESYDQSRCTKIHSRLWQEGLLIMNKIKEICITPSRELQTEQVGYFQSET